MYNLTAYAERKDGDIHVTISGMLANSCWVASVKDKYPGGRIVYFVDPGSAQVFIEELMRPGSEVCTMALVPWIVHVFIPSAKYDQVSIYINGEVKLRVDVVEAAVQYRVIALTASPTGSVMGCSIIPANAPYLAIYSSVFGPDLKSNCEDWRKKNCVLI